MNVDAKIAGRYLVEGRLGVGGMSTVLLAVDERLERHVAVKLLAEHLADDPSFVSRFRREALSAARLVHPNVVQVFDFGLDERTHQHFIVMEYVKGQSCAEILRDRGHLNVEQGIDIVIQACRGLDYAHRNGVVHRDVKPGNLMVSEAGVVKLADFGIARATDQTSITQVGSVLGTAAYLAPEQARGEEAGPASDLYSLGVVTYQLLSGRLPYEATSLSDLALKQQREAPTPLIDLNPTVPAELSDAVGLSISLIQDDRPQDAMEFAELIGDAARGVSPWADDSAATRVVGNTRSTRVLPPEPSTAQTRVTPRGTPASSSAPRTPRTVPANRPLPVPPRTPAGARSSSGGRGSRVAGWMLGIAALIVVLVIVIVLLVHTGSSAEVHFKKVVANDAGSAITQIRDLIHKYTK